MVWKFIWKIIPVPVFYTDRFVRLAGRSFGIAVVVKKKYKNDESIVAHELIHCKQWYRTLGIHGILYKLSDKYKLKSEVEAYKETIRIKDYKDNRGSAWIVKTLVENYKLDVTKEEVEALLYAE